MMRQSRLQQLTQTFRLLKRSKDALPSGCCSVELLDDDDITAWYVQLEYTPPLQSTTSSSSAPVVVSLKLQFVLDDPVLRMPQVYVIQPRLIANFIHHGAVCSLELMSQCWTLSLDSVQCLIACLHETLNVFDSRVTIDTERATYSSGEHENGARHIRSAHLNLFRSGAGGGSTFASQKHDADDAEDSEGDIVNAAAAATAPTLSHSSSTRAPPIDSVVSGSRTPTTDILQRTSSSVAELPVVRRVVVSSASEFLAALRTYQDEAAHAEQQQQQQNQNNTSSKNSVVPAALSSSTSSLTTAATTDGAPSILQLHLTTTLAITLDEAITLSHGHIQVSSERSSVSDPSHPDAIQASSSTTTNRLTFVHGDGDVAGPCIIVERGAELEIEGVDLHLDRSSFLSVLGSLKMGNVTFTGSIVAEDHGKFFASHCTIIGTCALSNHETVAALDQSVVELSQCLVERCSNNGESQSTTLLVRAMIVASNSSVLRITDNSRVVPFLVEKSVFAEQEASLMIADSTIVAGTSCAVSVQSCSGLFSQCTFTSPCEGVQLQVDDSNRPTGLNAELGGKITAVNCTAHNLYFGFSTIAFSVASYTNCKTANVVNGFTVDASTATLDHCFAKTHHVGLFVLNKAKCLVTSSRCGGGGGESSGGEGGSSCAPLTLSYSNAHLSSASKRKEGADESGVERFGAMSCRADDAARQQSGAGGEEDHRWTHTSLHGDFYGIEVRGATLTASNVILTGARDTALYAYENSNVDVEHMFICSGNVPIGTSACGIKLYRVQATIAHCFCENYPFSFAVIQCTTTTTGNSGASATTGSVASPSIVSFAHCYARGGTNGFTVDASATVAMHNCGADTDHVGLFVLNQSRVDFHNDDSSLSGGDDGCHIPPRNSSNSSCSKNNVPPQEYNNNNNDNDDDDDDHPHRQQQSEAFLTIQASCYGIEIKESHVTCTGIRVTRASDSAFNCYNHAVLTAVDCVADLGDDDDDGADAQRGTNAQKTSGFKVWTNSSLEAVRCHALHAVFGFAAIGQQSRITARHCTAKFITNGFTIDAASAKLTECATDSKHVGVYALRKGCCIIEGGTYAAKMFGLEVRGSRCEARGCSISKFQRSAVYLYDSADLVMEDVRIVGYGSGRTAAAAAMATTSGREGVDDEASLLATNDSSALSTPRGITGVFFIGVSAAAATEGSGGDTVVDEQQSKVAATAAAASGIEAYRSQLRLSRVAIHQCHKAIDAHHCSSVGGLESASSPPMGIEDLVVEDCGDGLELHECVCTITRSEIRVHKDVFLSTASTIDILGDGLSDESTARASNRRGVLHGISLGVFDNCTVRMKQVQCVCDVLSDKLSSLTSPTSPDQTEKHALSVSCEDLSNAAMFRHCTVSCHDVHWNRGGGGTAKYAVCEPVSIVRFIQCKSVVFDDVIMDGMACEVIDCKSMSLTDVNVNVSAAAAAAAYNRPCVLFSMVRTAGILCRLVVGNGCLTVRDHSTISCDTVAALMLFVSHSDVIAQSSIFGHKKQKRKCGSSLVATAPTTTVLLLDRATLTLTGCHLFQSALRRPIIRLAGQCECYLKGTAKSSNDFFVLMAPPEADPFCSRSSSSSSSSTAIIVVDKESLLSVTSNSVRIVREHLEGCGDNNMDEEEGTTRCTTNKKEVDRIEDDMEAKMEDCYIFASHRSIVRSSGGSFPPLPIVKDDTSTHNHANPQIAVAVIGAVLAVAVAASFFPLVNAQAASKWFSRLFLR